MEVYHMCPVSDTKKHIIEQTSIPMYNPVTRITKYRVTNLCSCNPRIEYRVNGDIVIAHNSFDRGRNFEFENCKTVKKII